MSASKKGFARGNHEMYSQGVPKRCFETHPVLKIGKYEVYGGSCAYPVVKDADIYVGFDHSMAKSVKQWPWEHGESFLFHIPDMGVPSSPELFKNLIDWLASALVGGNKVHLGCIGGHGRTGMVLSALVKVMTSTEDSITYVRENYCQKAVESATQVRFLHEHFGIKVVRGAKEYDPLQDKASFKLGYSIGGGAPGVSHSKSATLGGKASSNFKTPEVPQGACVASPVASSKLSIWG